MPNAREVAEVLAYDFLKEGSFSAALGQFELAPPLVAAAVIDRVTSDPEIGAFIGLSVQAVGYEDGVDDPRVFIYLTNGSARFIRSLPSEIADVPVVTLKMGALSVRPQAAVAVASRGNYYERGGRVCCGSSCAPTSESGTGTIGAVVRMPETSTLFLLSNNHVFAGCNHVPKGQPIIAPSTRDSRPGISAPQEVARHDQIHELRSGNPEFVIPCEVDAALARVTNSAIISSWQGDDAFGYDTPSAVALPTSQTPVKKFGRTTGLTHGNIESKVAAFVPVPYTAQNFKGTIWFKEVWIVHGRAGDPFALQGDSGSLVVTEDGTRALGLVFACTRNGDLTVMVPMTAVSAAFGGIDLVNGYGI
jgi:hypothetical protein